MCGRLFLSATVAMSLSAATAANADAPGLIKLDAGSSSRGAYVIQRIADVGDNVCIQVSDRTGRRPTFGCGPVGTARQPIGFVIADYNTLRPRRLVYGIVSDDVARVRVLGKGSEHSDVTPHARAGLPGRFFSVKTRRFRRVEVVAYNSSGQELQRLGSRSGPSLPERVKQGGFVATTHEELVASGEPAGFAPTVQHATYFTYHGQKIDPDDAAKRQLACMEDEYGVRCYDTPAELKEAEKARAKR